MGRRLRFAPSPTGRLHLGHALSALLNVEMARRLSAELIIRIEDTDLARCRPENTAAILADLKWLGITSAIPILRQSEHLAVYDRAIEWLEAMGLVYPCFATRQEIQSAAQGGEVDPDGAPIYPGIWRGADAADVSRRMAEGEPFALRLDMAKAIAWRRRTDGGPSLFYRRFAWDLSSDLVEVLPERWGDVVVRRKEGSAAYHLAVVVDDDRQRISHVVRGTDLEAATDIHRLLQGLLGLSSPAYHHHRLIADRQGRKLSKRDGDTSLATLRAQGATPDDIRRRIGLDTATPA